MVDRDPWMIVKGALTSLRLPPVYYWINDPADLISEWERVSELFARTASDLGEHPTAVLLADAANRITGRLPAWIATGKPDMEDHEALVGEIQSIGHQVDNFFGLAR